jgi:hypothetical protein
MSQLAPLEITTHVFLRQDTKRQALEPPWQDPVGAAVGGFQSPAGCVLAEEDVGGDL